MGTKDNGLTLEGLAKRLEALERENDELRSKVATLEGSGTRRDELAETRSLVPLRDGERASGFEGRVSRRSLLSKAGVAAAGLVVAGALTQTDIREAKAAQIIGDSNQSLRGGVEGTNNAQLGFGVIGKATDGWGVDGQADRGGVRGSSLKGVGVQGSGYPGVMGWGYGHVGSGGTGVKGDGDVGVWGNSRSLGWSSVYGEHLGEAGYGVTGDGKGTSRAGVLGRNPAGYGGHFQGATAVRGEATSGYGGFFQGGKAQLRIVPKSTAGRPTSGNHAKGEISMDSAATLWVCTVAGTPGTWRKVTTTAT